MTLTIHLVRHAPVHPHRAHTVYGDDANIIDISDTTDPAVTALTRSELSRQFDALAQRLPTHAPVLITPARRTRQTADEVCARQNSTGRIRMLYPWFVEQRWGDWTDQPHHALQKRDPTYRFLLNKGPGWDSITPPNHKSGSFSESFNDLRARAEFGFSQLLVARALANSEEAVAFTHGGIIRTARLLFGGVSVDEAIHTKVAHLSVTTLQHDRTARGQWRIIQLAQLP